MEARQFYAVISQRYNDETFGGDTSLRAFARHVRTEAVLGLIDRHMKPGGTIADVGCGPAQYAEPLLQRGFTYHGIDIAPEMYAPVQKKLAGDPKAKFSVGTIENIPLETASVDGAIVVGVIEYVASDAKSFPELHRVLKPGGILVVTFPNVLNPWHAIRTLLRPVLSPVLRRLARNPEIANTVWVSDMVYRVFRPNAVAADLERAGFEVVDHVCHGYDVYPRDHSLAEGRLARKISWESTCSRILPGFGSNYIMCLRKR
jgi:SAM-dependent methyltransferase